MKTAWAAAIVTVIAAGLILRSQTPRSSPLPFKPAFENQARAPQPARRSRYAVETIASGLDRPWSLAFLPNGHVLITERAGRMRIIDQTGHVSDPLDGLPPLLLAGGHGLADVVLDPAFTGNRRIYFTHLAPPPGQAPRSVSDAEMNEWLRRPVAERLKDPLGIPRVARARLSADEKTLEDVSIVLVGADRRLVFGHDGTLFATAETHTSGGVSFVDDLPQRLDNPFGKVLRVNPDGSIPRDNSFAGKADALPEIYAIGVRDPEGAAIEPSTGRLWINEHWVKGGDELNVIRPGANYGFPIITDGVNYNDEPDWARPDGKGRDGTTGVILESRYRSIGSVVLHRDAVSGMDGGLVHRITAGQAPRPAAPRTRPRRLRGAVAHRARVAHPRYPSGSRPGAVRSDGRRQRSASQDRAPAIGGSPARRFS
jgi:glucose/arabinose dehydrogenase